MCPDVDYIPGAAVNTNTLKTSQRWPWSQSSDRNIWLQFLKIIWFVWNIYTWFLNLLLYNLW